MKKLISLLTFIIIFCNGSFSQSAKPIQDMDWSFVSAPVRGIANDSVAKKQFGPNSAAYYAWDEYSKIAYRDRGTAFFERWPNDPHFKEWFLKTTGDYAPSYWKDPGKQAMNYADFVAKGSPLTPEFDDAAENDWQRHYFFFRSIFLADTTIARSEKNDFRAQQLETNIFRLGEKIARGTGDMNACFKKRSVEINSYCREAADMSLEPERNLLPLQFALMEFGEHDSVISRNIRSLLNNRYDSNERSRAASGDSLAARQRSGPMQIKLPGLNFSGQLDLEKLRGKPVLIEFWNVHCAGCIAAMPKYQRVYQQFKNDGFEMVSVCVFLNDAERRRALEIMQKKGVTYPVAEIRAVVDKNGEFEDNTPGWKDFGQAAGGSAFLLDQKGVLVATEMPGQWLEFNIRKLLKLPLDKTGKE